MRKKTICAAAGAAIMLLSLFGCADEGNSFDSATAPPENDHEVSAVGSQTTAVSDEFETITEDSSLTPYDEPVTYEVEIIDDAGSGEPVSYQDLRDGYLPYYDNLSVISYEIVSVYSPEEAFELTGEEAFTRRTTLYNVHVYYDHILDEEVDYNMNIAHVGNTQEQLLGFPMYETGMRFAAAVFGSSDTWRVPVGELEFLLLSENGDEIAYHIGSAPVSGTDGSLPMNDELDADECELMLSASNNPMVLSSKARVEELGEFIRGDWSGAGIVNAQ